MIRIAKVKFTSGGKLLNYICKDKRIKEGDVVYVEGKEQPVYVYEINEVEENTVPASKKVIGIAKENPDVNLATRYMNIIDCKCECIVNSLGTETSVFGAICESIVNNAKSKEIDNMLRFHQTEDVFWTYITDAGQLPSKHIIHIVMPFKDEDDHNKNLRKAFETVIDLAIEKGYESLAIPFIGTGANGYSKSDVHEALDDTMFKYQYKQGIKINIVSINYSSTRTRRYGSNQESPYEEYNRSRNYPERVSFDIYGDYKKQIKDVTSIISKLYKREDEFDLSKVEKPVDFISEYRKVKGYKETDEINKVFGTYKAKKLKPGEKEKKISNKFRDVFKNVKRGKRSFSKYEIIRIAIALELNFTQLIQLMTLFDYSFNPFSIAGMDYEIFNFVIHNNGFVNSYESEPYQYFFNILNPKAYDILIGDAEVEVNEDE